MNKNFKQENKNCLPNDIDLEKCQKLLVELKKQKDSGPFQFPVNLLGYLFILNASVQRLSFTSQAPYGFINFGRFFN